MQIETMLKNALNLLDQTLIPGSESLKMAAAKNDIQKAAQAAREIREQMDRHRAEIQTLREELEDKMAELRTLQDVINEKGDAQNAED